MELYAEAGKMGGVRLWDILCQVATGESTPSGYVAGANEFAAEWWIDYVSSRQQRKK